MFLTQSRKRTFVKYWKNMLFDTHKMAQMCDLHLVGLLCKKCGS